MEISLTQEALEAAARYALFAFSLAVAAIYLATNREVRRASDE